MVDEKEQQVPHVESSDVEENGKIISDDDALLISMGKTGELKRVYNFWTLCAYQIMMMCSWNCNIILYGTVFDLGGPMALVWGTLVVAIAGGQQYYTQALATSRYKPLLSYFIGWVVLFGEITVSSSCALNSAGVIESFVGVTHPDFVWKSWMTWAIYSLFLLGSFIQNLFPRFLPAMNVFGAVWVVGGGLAWAISFLVLAPKSSSGFVFKLFLNNSGYGSKRWVFIMSFYTPIFGLPGTDGVLHLVEEMEDASRQAPRVVVWSMVFSSLTSWASVLVMMFCAGNWETYMDSVQPYLLWFMDVIGSIYGGGVFCALLCMGINYFVIIGQNTAASRLAWSMARDNALPFSPFFSKINKTFDIPLRALTAVLIVDIVLGLIVLGSDVAFQAIVSCGGICFQIGYVTPIVILLVRGRKILPVRPNFDLGKLGYAVNILSVGWSLMMIVVLFFPLYVPGNRSTIANMNWSIVVIGALILFPGIYWITHGRHQYLKIEEGIIEGIDKIGEQSGDDVLKC